MPQTPTSAELAKHRQVVAKLRAELFCDHTPESLFIVPGSEAVVPPYVDGRIAQGREVSYGGLSFQVTSPKPHLWYEVIVKHRAKDEFDIFLSVRDGRTLGYVRFAMTRPFHVVASELRRAIEEARAEDRGEFTGMSG